MEQKTKNGKFSQSITFKVLIIGFLILLLLIPKFMIQNLISERKYRSIEAIQKINAKWSLAQTFCGPVLAIPFSKKVTDGNKVSYEKHVWHVAPEVLNIDTKLFPEERYYGIYKTIVYSSNMKVSGKFPELDYLNDDELTFHKEKAYIEVGVSDLRGVTNNMDFVFGNKHYNAEAGDSDNLLGKKLVIYLNDSLTKNMDFNFDLELNGSDEMNFIPVGKTTNVKISGDWKSPGFIGNFSPKHEIEKGFDATWNILHFNRNIPETWVDKQISSFSNTSFGVNLVDTVDHYQQNMRSAKYAIMFIALTFMVFFFVEVITRKRIHPIQYLLVGLALILFYSLLLSISEQLNFALAYIIASIATIALISAYAQSIFKNKMHTAILTVILCVLYTFLYVILQLEDVSLLIGSIGLFIILGIVMYFSRKINWYKQEEIEE